jgi:ammonium transporter, Amt family
VTQPQPVAEVAEAEDANRTPAWAMAAASLAAALALPGIAMFQAGLLRAGSVNTLLLHHVTIAAVGFLLWVAAGFSATVSRTGMSAGSLGLRSVLGAFDMAMLKGVFSSAQAAVDPAQLLRVAHSLVPALLAPCIVVGVAAGPGGLLWDLHLLDGAGSIALNTAAGFSAVMLARVVGARRKPGRGSHNLPSTVLGTALLAVGLLAHMAGACVTGTSAVTTLVAAQVRMSCCRFAANQIIWKALCDLWFV